jgi:hypothetical protein
MKSVREDGQKSHGVLEESDLMLLDSGLSSVGNVHLIAGYILFVCYCAKSWVVVVLYLRYPIIMLVFGKQPAAKANIHYMGAQKHHVPVREPSHH